ncbi:MAG: amidase [Acidimicrobiia bacterium]
MTAGAVQTAVAEHLARLHDAHRRTRAVQWFDDERALADAATLDAVPAGTGSPLHGLPITVKDWIDVTGFPCAGNDSTRRDRRPTEDATAVARLRAAGAVVLAKTKAWDGIDPEAPPVGHPLDPSRTPGGSSTGEAVVTAVGASPLGIGSDSGGSVRYPAALCGVYGLKPTTGLVPGTGHFPRVGAWSDGRTTIGFLGTDLDLIEAALRVTAGPDDRDAGAVPVPIAPVPAAVTGLRIAAPAPDPAWPVDAAIERAIEATVDALVAAGAVRTTWTWEWRAEALDVTERYWSRTRLSGAETARQLCDWDRFRRRYLTATDAVDVLVTPVAAGTAPVHGPVAHGDFVHTLPASLTGSPALSVPAGSAADGFPIAVQLIARPWRDHLVLAAARALAATTT